MSVPQRTPKLQHSPVCTTQIIYYHYYRIHAAILLEKVVSFNLRLRNSTKSGTGWARARTTHGPCAKTTMTGWSKIPDEFKLLSASGLSDIFMHSRV